jgi:hypothetical protein
MTDLCTLGGGISYAYSINDRGQIVGYSRDSSGNDRAFLCNSVRPSLTGNLLLLLLDW